jgi:restriction endonuclease S subunit
VRMQWSIGTLGDKCEMYQPKTISGKEMVEDGAYPVYGANGIIGRYNKFNHEEPQLLITCRGATCGSVNISAPKSWITGNAMVVRPTDETIDLRFLEYLFRGGLDISRAITGAAQPQITRTNLEPLEISYPPVPEQKRIVAILDEAFEGIEKAKSNAEKNLQNARALFGSHLQSVFNQKEITAASEAPPSEHCEDHAPPRRPDETTFALGTGEAAHRPTIGVTRTGGRAATLRKIPGRFSLAVGAPNAPARKGWRWSLLTDLARLESGHTPSRKHPEYWGGPIPWIGIQDAREWHGRTIEETIQHTNDLGIANSAARILPGNTVCLSRTASVGYVVVTGKPMATSQDFVNWVCSDLLMPHFLKYLLLAEGRGLLRFASGSVHSTIYFPEVKAFYVCYPSRKEQARIVDELDALRSGTERLESIYQQKLSSLEELKKSLLHEAFAGAL